MACKTVNGRLLNRGCLIWLLSSITWSLLGQIATEWEKIPLNVSNGLSDNNIFHIFKDSRGFVWIATQYGVNRYDGYEYRTFTYHPSDSNSISENWVYFTLEDRAGYLWMGTYGGGLNRFDPRTENFKHQSNNAASLNNDIILSIFENKKGDIWIGSDGGLNRLPAGWTFGEQPVFQRYMRSDGLGDDKIMSINEDANEHICISHPSHGLSKLSPQNDSIQRYTTADGLPSPLFYWTSVWKRPDRALLYGTTEGLVVFHPDSLKIQNRVAPSTSFTDILLFGQKIMIGGNSPKMLMAPAFAPTLSLKHDQNSLTFRFSALNFIHSELNRYAYRLAPLDATWRDLGTQQSVSFSHLPPGRYTLQVKACNNEGVWEDTGAVINFRIHPPWWLTAWAVLVYVSLLAAGVWWWFYRQLRASRQLLWEYINQAPTFANNARPHSLSGPEVEFLQKLYGELEKNLDNEYYSVEQLAKALTMSRSQLHRKVVEYTGFSSGQVLQHKRLGLARQLLTETDLTIAEIAFRCGYSDPNYFTRLFSKTQGVTPSEFAKSKYL